MKKLLVSLLLTLVGVMTMTAQEMPPVPVDPSVRIGKLDNGLTYYIRHNNWPEQRAEFYIAQKVGSIQEDDNQRGLAHFLEHMAFNGSKHFKGNELLRWCESVGIQFGTDLNAYTSIDQTVYNISNVPTTREGIVDSCLLILYDWADGLLLEQEEIEKERGVIHEEWRLRTSAQTRMLERDLPKLYPGSKYGYRMPIGLMEIIDNFERPFLQAYYEKWYRPDNQGIIVVGDVNVDKMEQKIKDLFSSIAAPAADAAKVVMEPVPDNNEAIYVIDQDKEQRFDVCYMMMKHEAFPDSLKSSMVYLITDYLSDAAITMLSNRLKEKAEQADCPFLQCSAGDGNFLLSRSVDCFELDVIPKEGKTEEALQAALTEARRAAEFGFTPTEYNRFKADFTSTLDKNLSNKDKRFNRQFVNQYVNHFLENEPIPSIEDYTQIMKQIVPMLPLEGINALIKQYVATTDTNLVVLSLHQEKEGAKYPTEAGMKKAIAQARAAKLQAYVDNVKDEPLMTQLPQKGSIVSEKKSNKFDYTELTLSNGATVVLKHTDLKKDQVLLNATGFGGSALYGATDFANIKAFDDVIGASGLGNFSHTELEKALAGKIASATFSLGQNRAVISGSSTPKDLETLLQLVYLNMTSIKKDQKSYDNTLQTMETVLKSRLLQPEGVFSDSLTKTMTCHNPRFASLDVKDIPSINYDRVLRIAKEQTANARAFTFYITGNYDEQQIRPLIEQYLASLPSQEYITKSNDVSTDFKGKVVNSFKQKAETPKAIAVMVWNTKDIPFSLASSVKTNIIGELLQMEYLKKIREDASAAYTVNAMCSSDIDDFGSETTLLAYCPMKPEKADVATDIMRKEVASMTTTCDADKLQKVKEYMLKNHSDKQKTNNYWQNVIGVYRNHGVDLDTDYVQMVQAQSPERICTFVKEMLKGANTCEVIMLPE
ncbi:MAG: insulinase family protein [Prevotella sp.]|nr:insulinase family protein [Prevotella sp.]